MGSAPSGVEPETNPEVERLLREQRGQRPEAMQRRELLGELAIGLSFLVACALLLGIAGAKGFDVVAAGVIFVTYAAATRVRFEIGGGSTDVTLLVLIPAYFLEPPATVPLLIAAGFAGGRSIDVAQGRLKADRLLAALGNSWHVIGPAVVLLAAVKGQAPTLRNGAWYVLAFLAYVALDTGAGLTREWLTHGVRPRLQLQMLRQVYALDALLAPLGLLAALADSQQKFAFLLAGPLLAVLGVLARERGKRLDNALALSESRSQLLEAELEATRARVEVLGAVSHGLQTPVAGIVALAAVLRRRAPAMDEAALADVVAHLEEDAVALRQLVRQGLDYVRLMEGDDLALRDQTFDVAAVARRVAERMPGVTLDLPPGGDAVPVRGDPARVDQVLTALADRSQRVSISGSGAQIAVRPDGERVGVVVRDDGPPVGEAELARITAPPTGAIGTDESQGTGVDLYVAAQLVSALGGVLGAAPGSGGLALTLPAG